MVPVIPVSIIGLLKSATGLLSICVTYPVSIEAALSIPGIDIDDRFDTSFRVSRYHRVLEYHCSTRVSGYGQDRSAFVSSAHVM